jgi:hypothetical protein
MTPTAILWTVPVCTPRIAFTTRILPSSRLHMVYTPVQEVPVVGRHEKGAGK